MIQPPTTCVLSSLKEYLNKSCHVWYTKNLLQTFSKAIPTDLLVQLLNWHTSCSNHDLPLIEFERGSRQVAPCAHASAASPVGGLGREQPRAAPSPGGGQILRLEVDPRRVHLLLCIRRRGGRRDGCRGMKFRQCLVVPCSGAHLEQGDRRGSVLASKRIPRLTLVKQGEQLTERRLVRPMFPLSRRELHFVARDRSTGERIDLRCPSDIVISSAPLSHRGLRDGNAVRPNVAFQQIADHFRAVEPIAQLEIFSHHDCYDRSIRSQRTQSKIRLFLLFLPRFSLLSSFLELIHINDSRFDLLILFYLYFLSFYFYLYKDILLFDSFAFVPQNDLILSILNSFPFDFFARWEWFLLMNGASLHVDKRGTIWSNDDKLT